MRTRSKRQTEQQIAQPPLARLPHLREQVVAHLVRHIVGGYYPPGSTFPTETELAHTLGVSRALVREAVRALAEKGLVEVRHGIGTRVRLPSEWNQLDPAVLFERIRTGKDETLLRDLLELRAVLDITAAELAAQRRTLDDLSVLEQALRAMRRSLNDPLAYAQHDAAFHEAIVEAAHNQLIAVARRPLGQVLVRAWELTDRLPGRMEASQRGHEQIAAAIVAQDVTAARQAMAQHVQQFEDDIREALRHVSPSALPEFLHR
ncbi:MAG: FadR family transcriptional regulator [Thermorudis peleae]|nr:FadR family transcriptional regulator [Thermorudis peleae]